jgi:hypothetical protein
MKAEQTFARFYANVLASLEIISSNPKIDSLFETWRKESELKLEENEELKVLFC